MADDRGAQRNAVRLDDAVQEHADCQEGTCKRWCWRAQQGVQVAATGKDGKPAKYWMKAARRRRGKEEDDERQGARGARKIPMRLTAADWVWRQS